jgi:hypothetical protein
MDSMKQQNSGADSRRSNVRKAGTNFDEFVDDNIDVGDDDYEFISVGQGNRFESNRAKRNVSFRHVEFSIRERILDILGIVTIQVES